MDELVQRTDKVEELVKGEKKGNKVQDRTDREYEHIKNNIKQQLQTIGTKVSILTSTPPTTTTQNLAQLDTLK